MYRLGHPKIYLFLLYKNCFLGLKCPNIILLYFENKNAVHHHIDTCNVVFRILTGRVFQMAAIYVAFFAGGSLLRLSRYGKFLPQKRGKQYASSGHKRMLLFFAIAVPTLHWAIAYTYGSAGMPQAGVFISTAGFNAHHSPCLILQN